MAIWYFMYFMIFFSFLERVFWGLLRIRMIISVQLFVAMLYRLLFRWLTFRPTIFNVWMRGLYLFFSFLPHDYLRIYHGSRWIIRIIYCLMGFGGGMDVWPSMGAANMHNMSGLSRAMHVHVFERHVHCINLIPRLWCLGASCIGCQHLLGYRTLCAYWIRLCGLFDVPLWCVKLCEGLLCVGG